MLKDALSGLRQILATEVALKMMKNAFYFTLKSLFVLKIFKFLSWLFGHVEKLVDYKYKINFKVYDVTTWETVGIPILSNIPRSKDNQSMKFVRLIEYNMRNIFLEKSYTKCGWESIPRPFSKNWACLCIISLIMEV